ncbi:MAG: DNA polymerase IV [Proteobacteria bacterium]|nr:DNA polymerase IV [Pseudomonadota bacterium]
MPQSPPPARYIAHLDMDAFYASVELLRYPELRGKPVVIGGGSAHRPEESVDARTGRVMRRFHRLEDYRGRGVITTCTYEARALGLRSAQPMMKAAALAPQAYVLPADFTQYRAYSRRFKEAVRALAPAVEDRGIDEIYIDLTELVAGADAREDADVQWQRARAVAQQLKDAVRAATGLSCSIAVTPNKLLSKIASELDKPDGLTLVAMADLPERIWPLPAARINGIGPKASARLAALGVTTIGELAACPPQWLVEHFGRSHGAWMHEAAHGRDARPVVTYSEPRSISRETTFDRDLSARHDRAALAGILDELCAGVAADLTRKGYAARTLGVKLRFDDFRTVTRDHTVPIAVADAAAIRAAAGTCLTRVEFSRRIRLLGVRATGLVPAGDAARDANVPVALPLFA